VSQARRVDGSVYMKPVVLFTSAIDAERLAYARTAERIDGQQIHTPELDGVSGALVWAVLDDEPDAGCLLRAASVQVALRTIDTSGPSRCRRRRPSSVASPRTKRTVPDPAAEGAGKRPAPAAAALRKHVVCDLQSGILVDAGCGRQRLFLGLRSFRPGRRHDLEHFSCNQRLGDGRQLTRAFRDRHRAGQRDDGRRRANRAPTKPRWDLRSVDEVRDAWFIASPFGVRAAFAARRCDVHRMT